jgi:hypothetical protein
VFTDKTSTKGTSTRTSIRKAQVPRLQLVAKKREPHPGSIPRCGFYLSVRASSVSRFLDQKSTASQPTACERRLFPPEQSSKTFSRAKNHRPPHPSGCERRLFPPEQSSKTSILLNGFRVDGNKFRLNFSDVIYAEFDNERHPMSVCTSL